MDVTYVLSHVLSYEVVGLGFVSRQAENAFTIGSGAQVSALPSRSGLGPMYLFLVY